MDSDSRFIKLRMRLIVEFLLAICCRNRHNTVSHIHSKERGIVIRRNILYNNLHRKLSARGISITCFHVLCSASLPLLFSHISTAPLVDRHLKWIFRQVSSECNLTIPHYYFHRVSLTIISTVAISPHIRPRFLNANVHNRIDALTQSQNLQQQSTSWFRNGVFGYTLTVFAFLVIIPLWLVFTCFRLYHRSQFNQSSSLLRQVSHPAASIHSTPFTHLHLPISTHRSSFDPLTPPHYLEQFSDICSSCFPFTVCGHTFSPHWGSGRGILLRFRSSARCTSRRIWVLFFSVIFSSPDYWHQVGHDLTWKKDLYPMNLFAKLMVKHIRMNLLSNQDRKLIQKNNHPNYLTFLRMLKPTLGLNDCPPMPIHFPNRFSFSSTMH